MTTPGTYTASASTIYVWDSTPVSGSQYNAANAQKGDAFDFVRTDGSAWGSDGTHQNIDGSASSASPTSRCRTAPPVAARGRSRTCRRCRGACTGTWTRRPSTSNFMSAASCRSAAGSGGTEPATRSWTTNSAANNNWGTAQPFSAGQIATFDGTVVNYGGGVVNVDAPQTLGGMVFNKGTGGGYTIGTNGGNSLTLNNGAADATIAVSTGGAGERRQPRNRSTDRAGQQLGGDGGQRGGHADAFGRRERRRARICPRPEPARSCWAVSAATAARPRSAAAR